MAPGSAGCRRTRSTGRQTALHPRMDLLRTVLARMPSMSHPTWLRRRCITTRRTSRASRATRRRSDGLRIRTRTSARLRADAYRMATRTRWSVRPLRHYYTSRITAAGHRRSGVRRAWRSCATGTRGSTTSHSSTRRCVCRRATSERLAKENGHFSYLPTSLWQRPNKIRCRSRSRLPLCTMFSSVI